MENFLNFSTLTFTDSLKREHKIELQRSILCVMQKCNTIYSQKTRYAILFYAIHWENFFYTNTNLRFRHSFERKKNNLSFSICAFNFLSFSFKEKMSLSAVPFWYFLPQREREKKYEKANKHFKNGLALFNLRTGQGFSKILISWGRSFCC